MWAGADSASGRIPKGIGNILTPRYWLVLSIVCLLVAYIPLGWLGAVVGVAMPIAELKSDAGWMAKIGWTWLFLATVAGNLQIVLCLFSLSKPSVFLQNHWVKTVATFGQLSWAFLGCMFYPWYFWVIGSAILFTVTPHSSFGAKTIRHQWRHWKDSTLLEKLRKMTDARGGNLDGPR